MISILSNTSPETLILLEQSRNFSFLMLCEPLLLIEHITKLIVLILKDLAMSIHFIHENCIGGVDGCLVQALGWRYHTAATSLFCLL
jgi:hypothetical protein